MGCGLFLVQLAARAGIRTIAVGRREMHETMLSLGATDCVDYIHEDVATRAQEIADGPVDAIADLVGGATAGAALPSLRPGGSIASVETPEFTFDQLGGREPSPSTGSWSATTPTGCANWPTCWAMAAWRPVISRFCRCPKRPGPIGCSNTAPPEKIVFQVRDEDSNT